MVGVLVVIGVLSALVVLVIEVWHEIKNVYCQARHTLEPQSWYYVPPFNISKGWQEYAVVCKECDRIVRYMTQKEYDALLHKKDKAISASFLATIIVAVLDWIWGKWNDNDVTEIIDSTDINFDDLELRRVRNRAGTCGTKTGTESGNSATCKCCVLRDDEERGQKNC